MVIETIRGNLVRATPEEGKRLVSVGGKTVAEGSIYVPSPEAVEAWSEMDLAEAEGLKAQWEAETEETEAEEDGQEGDMAE